MEHDFLARRAQEGDRDAFAELYDAFAPKIHAYAYYRTFRREAAEDVTATVFMKALERLETFRPEAGGFSAWIYGIARTTLVDHYRERSRFVEDARGDLADVWELEASGSLELDAENRDRWERLKPHLAALTREQREIVLLRVWDELPFAEIGRMLGKTEGACKTAFSRVLASLRQAMPLALLLSFLLEKPHI